MRQAPFAGFNFGTTAAPAAAAPTPFSFASSSSSNGASTPPAAANPFAAFSFTVEKPIATPFAPSAFAPDTVPAFSVPFSFSTPKPLPIIPTPSTSAGDRPPKSLQYYSSLRAINLSLLSSLESSIKADAFVDLSSVLTKLQSSYESKRKEITKDYENDGDVKMVVEKEAEDEVVKVVVPDRTQTFAWTGGALPSFGKKVETIEVEDDAKDIEVDEIVEVVVPDRTKTFAWTGGALPSFGKKVEVEEKKEEDDGKSKVYAWTGGALPVAPVAAAKVAEVIEPEEEKNAGEEEEKVVIPDRTKVYAWTGGSFPSFTPSAAATAAITPASSPAPTPAPVPVVVAPVVKAAPGPPKAPTTFSWGGQTTTPSATPVAPTTTATKVEGAFVLQPITVKAGEGSAFSFSTPTPAPVASLPLPTAAVAALQNLPVAPSPLRNAHTVPATAILPSSTAPAAKEKAAPFSFGASYGAMASSSTSTVPLSLPATIPIPAPKGPLFSFPSASASPPLSNPFSTSGSPPSFGFGSAKAGSSSMGAFGGGGAFGNVGTGGTGFGFGSGATVFKGFGAKPAAEEVKEKSDEVDGEGDEDVE